MSCWKWWRLLACFQPFICISVHSSVTCLPCLLALAAHSRLERHLTIWINWLYNFVLNLCLDFSFSHYCFNKIVLFVLLTLRLTTMQTKKAIWVISSIQYYPKLTSSTIISVPVLSVNSSRTFEFVLKTGKQSFGLGADAFPMLMTTSHVRCWRCLL